MQMRASARTGVIFSYAISARSTPQPMALEIPSVEAAAFAGAAIDNNPAATSPAVMFFVIESSMPHTRIPLVRADFWRAFTVPKSAWKAAKRSTKILGYCGYCGDCGDGCMIACFSQPASAPRDFRARLWRCQGKQRPLRNDGLL